MKAIADMSLTELAAMVASHLEQHNIPVVLVGGACVSVYSENRYQTSDLDFVERYHTKRQQLSKALAEIGFTEENRYFRHPESAWFLEFPTGPLAIGDSPVSEVGKLETEHGTLVMLTATDCVKDRLSAHYHWNDRQALEQAIWVAQQQQVDIAAIQAWSAQEGMGDKFESFRVALNG